MVSTFILKTKVKLRKKIKLVLLFEMTVVVRRNLEMIMTGRGDCPFDDSSNAKHQIIKKDLLDPDLCGDGTRANDLPSEICDQISYKSKLKFMTMHFLWV